MAHRSHRKSERWLCPPVKTSPAQPSRSAPVSFPCHNQRRRVAGGGTDEVTQGNAARSRCQRAGRGREPPAGLESAVTAPKQQTPSGTRLCDSPARVNDLDGSCKCSNNSSNKINFNGFN